MSFSSDIKQEIAKGGTNRVCCIQSELTALTQSCAAVHLSGAGRFRVVYSTGSFSCARRIIVLLKLYLHCKPQASVQNTRRFGNRKVCLIQLDERNSERLMIGLQMLKPANHTLRLNAMPQHTRTCCRRAYVRGLFLGCGTVSRPESGYHLAFRCPGSLRKARSWQRLLAKCGILTQRSVLGEGFLLYSKSADTLSAFLSLTGASAAKLRFENMLAQKSLRQHVTCLANCDNNNLRRQIDASSQQTELLRAYFETRGVDALPAQFWEAANIRLMHPDASYAELGSLCNPPMSKSGYAHRMQKLMDFIRHALKDSCPVSF